MPVQNIFHCASSFCSNFSREKENVCPLEKKPLIGRGETALAKNIQRSFLFEGRSLNLAVWTKVNTIYICNFGLTKMQIHIYNFP